MTQVQPWPTFVNPRSTTKCFHNLHGQSTDFHFLINLLKLINEFTCFISRGTVFHITGPKYLRAFFPNNSVFTL